MRKIAVLDQNTIDKIAAGEVVERPSSVVKELVENAIDAGATAVTVEIKEGGKSLIRITDNGGGIESSQVPLAFLRHATSKIERVEDLETIASLGFRGEALSSISAVSQVELITKTHSAVTGTRYVIEGGTEKSCEDIGAPDGTTFLVRNLFYNVPARAKFLKTAATEAGYISSLMEQMALSHPEISFKFIQNGQVKLHTSGNYQMKDVIYQIYGRDITRELLEVQFENEFLKMEGYIGKPAISRGNRNFENYYINGRYVKDRFISKAIEDAYKSFLMQHKFPFTALMLRMEGNDLDVNVHPAKREVRFSREAEVYQAVYQALLAVLSRRELIPEVTVGKENRRPPENRDTYKRGDVPEPFETRRIRETSPYPQQTKANQPSPENSEKSSFSEVPPFAEKNTASKNSRDVSFIKQAPALTLEEETLFSGSLKEAEEKAVAAAQVKDTVQTEIEEAFPENTVPIKSPAQSEAAACVEATVLPESPVRTEDPVQRELTGCIETAASPESSVRTESPEPPEPITHTESTAPSKPEAFSTKTFPVDTSSMEQMELFDDRLLSRKARSSHKLIGQIFDTYWLVQYEDKFYIIDQHAAHEKVYYERFVKAFREREIQSQYVSPPLIVTLNLQEQSILENNKEYFESFGFEIEPFGGKEYAISAVPTELLGMTSEALFLEMLDSLMTKSGRKNPDPVDIFAGKLATMACKAAIKGGNTISTLEANALIDELLGLENPYNCPHGRPTIISMTQTELEKKFKRIV